MSTMDLLKLIILAVSMACIASDDYTRFCYFTNWSQDRGVFKFTPENIDPDLCSHIVYAFAELKANRLVNTVDGDLTKDGAKGMYEKVNDLKKTSSNLKTLLAVGGRNTRVKEISATISTDTNMGKFSEQSIKFLREHNFDGLELDFEYPGDRNHPMGERELFTTFVQHVQQEFESEAKRTSKPRLLLAAKVAGAPAIVENAYEMNSISKSLDFIGVSTYDLPGASTPNGYTPLYTKKASNISVDWAMSHWKSRVVDPKKLLIGLPAYGRCFTADTAESDDPTGCPAGTHTKEGGFLALYEICQLMSTGDAKLMWKDAEKVSYIVSGNTWVGFDSVRSTKIKVDYMKKKGFGGWLFWDLSQDDFKGTECGLGPYPLLKAANDALTEIVDPEDNSKPDVGSKKRDQHPSPSPEESPEGNESPEADDENVSNSPNSPKPRDHYLRVCYYTNWSQYREGFAFFPENIDPSYCTHVIYAYANLVDGVLVAQESNDESTEESKGMYERLNNLKEVYDLKTLLAVGGLKAGTQEMTKMLSTPENRKTFCTTSIEYLRKHNFDGIYMAFQYPGSVGSPPEDKQFFTNLLEEFRETIESEILTGSNTKLLLSAAVAPHESIIEPSYEISKMSKYLDFIGVMTYDLHGAWDPEIGHNSLLYTKSSDNISVDWAMSHWKAHVEDPRKLIIGLASYGRCFTTKGSEVSGGCPAGKHTMEQGALSYYEICQLVIQTGANPMWDNDKGVPYVVVGTSWIGYDDKTSIKMKVDYMVRNGFGGWHFWDPSQDDFKGTECGLGPYPLLRMASDAVYTGGRKTKPTRGKSTTTATMSTAGDQATTTDEQRRRDGEKEKTTDIVQAAEGNGAVPLGRSDSLLSVTVVITVVMADRVL